MLTAVAYDIHMEQLMGKIMRFHAAMTEAGLPYRLVGGVSAFFHVFDREPDAARTTRDVDAAIDRELFPAVIAAAERAGFKYRHAADLDMLIDPDHPSARSAVHLVFLNEKVRAEYELPLPASPAVQTREGVWICSVADLLTMKLTSYRLKDKVHVQDMDGVGLITPEIEAGLTDSLRARLAEIRAQR